MDESVSLPLLPDGSAAAAGSALGKVGGGGGEALSPRSVDRPLDQLDHQALSFAQLAAYVGSDDVVADERSKEGFVAALDRDVNSVVRLAGGELGALGAVEDRL